MNELYVPPQQAWTLMAYPDDVFLSVFKSKIDNGIVYIGGADAIHAIHKRLYDLDKDLYLELYSPEAMDKLMDAIKVDEDETK